MHANSLDPDGAPIKKSGASYDTMLVDTQNQASVCGRTCTESNIHNPYIKVQGVYGK